VLQVLGIASASLKSIKSNRAPRFDLFGRFLSPV
jgi:hypothetical protein